MSLFTKKLSIEEKQQGGGPVVETSPSNAVGAGSIPGQRTKNPLALWLKDQKHRAETI